MLLTTITYIFFMNNIGEYDTPKLKISPTSKSSLFFSVGLGSHSYQIIWNRLLYKKSTDCKFL